MPLSRPSRWCFGLQDDSVFADFDIDQYGRVYLLRISFDGYGCCRTSETSSRMSLGQSAQFAGLIENEQFDSEEFVDLLLHYFKENDDVIWKDALEEHKLLPV